MRFMSKNCVARLGVAVVIACWCAPDAFAQHELSANRRRLQERYTEYVRTMAPAAIRTAEPRGPSIWEGLEALTTRRAELLAKHMPAEPEGGPAFGLSHLTADTLNSPLPVYPAIETLYEETDAEAGPDAQYNAECRELALRYLRDCANAGLFAELDGVLTREWTVPERLLDSELIGLEDIPAIAGARRFAMMDRARMRLALERGDTDELCAAFDQIMRLASVSARYPGMTPRRLAIGIAWQGIDELGHALARGALDAAACERLARSLDTARAWPAPSAMFKAERFAVLDASEAFYELYGYSPDRQDLVALVFGLLRARVLWHIRVYFNNLERLADMTVAARAGDAFDPAAFIERRHRWHVPLHVTLPGTLGILKWSDAFSSRVAGARTMLALERSRARDGAYPETLGAIAPEFLAATPVDTFSGVPLVYRRTQAGGYVLYSVGLDGTDDHGKVYASSPETALMRSSGAGYDYMLRDDSGR